MSGRLALQIPHCYASMDRPSVRFLELWCGRKPLIRYHPNATRSRLAVEDAPVPLKNASSIQHHARALEHLISSARTGSAFTTAVSCGPPVRGKRLPSICVTCFEDGHLFERVAGARIGFQAPKSSFSQTERLAFGLSAVFESR